MSTPFVSCFFDPPEVLDASVAGGIPGRGDFPLQVIADSGPRFGRECGLHYSDSTGAFIGVYVGPVGNETLLCIIGNGMAAGATRGIAANSRISIRSMSQSPITSGLLTMEVTTE